MKEGGRRGAHKCQRDLNGGQLAERKNKKRRTMGGGGIVMDIKWELVEKGEEIEVYTKVIIIRKVRADKKKWRIIGVYVNRDIEEKLQRVGEWMEGKEKRKLSLIGRDFNARMD